MDEPQLSRRQVEYLLLLVRQVCRIGHGEVVVSVKNGLPRFISVRLQEDLQEERCGKIVEALTQS